MTTTHRITTTAAVILSLAAAGAPAASARRTPGLAAASPHAPATVYSRPDKSMIPVDAPGRHRAARTAPQAVVRIQTPPSGFDWGDAGIGAAGGLALAMLGVGGGLVISHQRPRRTRSHYESAELTSPRRAASHAGPVMTAPPPTLDATNQADIAAGSTRLCSPSRRHRRGRTVPSADRRRPKRPIGRAQLQRRRRVTGKAQAPASRSRSSSAECWPPPRTEPAHHSLNNQQDP